MNFLRVLESRRTSSKTQFQFGVALTVALLSLTAFGQSAQAQGLVEGAGATGVAGSAAQGASGMGKGLGNMFGKAGDAMNTPGAQQSAPSPNAATAESAANATLVYPLAGLAKRDADLIVAAYKGDTPAVRRALAAGAKVDVRDRVYTWTPLMWASQNGHLGTVRYLLQKGANVNAKSNDPRRPVMLRIRQQQNEQVTDQFYAVQRRIDGFFSYNGGITPLMLASSGGYAQTMRELLARGAQIGTKTVGGETPLMCAAASGYLPAVQLLLDRGANVNDVDASGASPLMYAVIAMNTPTVRALLAKGADATLTQNGVTLETVANSFAVFDADSKSIAAMLRSAAARQKRVAKSTGNEAPTRRTTQSTETGKQFPKAADAKPFDDGILILR